MNPLNELDPREHDQSPEAIVRNLLALAEIEKQPGVAQQMRIAAGWIAEAQKRQSPN